MLVEQHFTAVQRGSRDGGGKARMGGSTDHQPSLRTRKAMTLQRERETDRGHCFALKSAAACKVKLYSAL
jgi:hypothetical protein